jgi:hypothetical protein
MRDKSRKRSRVISYKPFCFGGLKDLKKVTIIRCVVDHDEQSIALNNIICAPLTSPRSHVLEKIC